MLRKTDVPVILAANKCEGHAGETGYNEAYKLGLGTPIALSAEHGQGTDELYTQLRDAIAAHAKANPVADTDAFDEDDVAFDPETPFEDDPNARCVLRYLGARMRANQP